MSESNTERPSDLAMRAEFHQLVKDHLLGPADGEKELVVGSVRNRYLLGRLSPKKNGGSSILEESELTNYSDNSDGQETEDGMAEAPITSADSLFPSSIGLSFAVAKEVETISVIGRWGRYIPIKREDTYTDKKTKEEKSRIVTDWQRIPMEKSIVIPLVPGKFEDAVLLLDENENPIDVHLQARIRSRPDHWSITLYLTNDQANRRQLKDKVWVFQPELIVQSADGLSAIFIDRTIYGHTDKLTHPDQSMRMVYRNKAEFAVGHGVAVQAEKPHDNSLVATRLQTMVMPTAEVEMMDPPPPDEIPGAVVDMYQLSQLQRGQFGAVLTPLVQSYEAWIGRLRATIPTDATLKNYKHTAHNNLDDCQTALQRMAEGIALLDRDEKSAEAFRFANEAMYLQRTRSIYARIKRQEPESTTTWEDLNLPRNRSWRVFQLAFLLINLPSFVDPMHDARSDLTDLLWFPTGGGKTEAYLGVAAFAMGIRRLQRDQYALGYEGVTVLMRYTLRLLTLQQFQRATTLMAACELIRRQDPVKWGDELFRIGLWVGASSSPNQTKDAEAFISEKKSIEYDPYSRTGTASPQQLTSCPWCGRKLQVDEIEVDMERLRTIQYCSDNHPFKACPFSKKKAKGEGLPIVVVDEEIYHRLPTLVIATVDKFAQLTWKPETQALFGRVVGNCERHGFVTAGMEEQCLSHPAHKTRKELSRTKRSERGRLRPPDLIIQDELHLINGPLGTMVGLYETAVDALSDWQVDGKTVKAKVLASTATVRRAKEQVKGIFNRSLAVFPPPGLSADDNFFARKTASSDQRPSRLYVGICAPGISRMTTLIPVYTAYMAAAEQLRKKYGKSADPWLTTVGYFNSLRELGTMRTAVQDSVRNRLLIRKDTGKRNVFIDGNQSGIEELTSRKTAEEIPQILDRLEMPFHPVDVPYEKGAYPIDVVLATNMISVGVDVERLGLMITAGQPKATAEYIQATSRVGRSKPGVVATVYAWSRPRDLSHYERFEHYHTTFYNQVEALSVTPFSPRALDKGLTGVMVALIRQLGNEFNANDKADAVDFNHPIVEQMKKALIGRAGDIEGQQTAKLVEEMIQKRIDHWQAYYIKREGFSFTYSNRGSGNNGSSPLLLSMEDVSRETDARRKLFAVLNSLRDVSATAGVILDNGNTVRGTGQPVTEEEQSDE